MRQARRVECDRGIRPRRASGVPDRFVARSGHVASSDNSTVDCRSFDVRDLAGGSRSRPAATTWCSWPIASSGTLIRPLDRTPLPSNRVRSIRSITRKAKRVRLWSRMRELMLARTVPAPPEFVFPPSTARSLLRHVERCPGGHNDDGRHHVIDAGVRVRCSAAPG